MSINVKPKDWDKFDWFGVDPRHGHLRAKKILHLIPKEGIHLDIGTGRGDGTLVISKIKSCIGFDYGSVSTKIAKNKGLEIFQADARRMPFKSKIFDSITCLDVIEHIPEPEHAIREISRVIKDNGWLILQTPTQEMFKEKLLHFIRKHKIKQQKQPHDSSIKHEEVKALLEKNNIEVLSEKKIKNWDPHPLIRLISYTRLYYCKKEKNV